MLALVTASVNLGTMTLMGAVVLAAMDVTTHVMLTLVHATVGLGGMETNVTLGKSVSPTDTRMYFSYSQPRVEMLCSCPKSVN